MKALLLICVALAVPALALDVEAVIPFAFEVNDTIMPSGTYVFSFAAESPLVAIRTVEGDKQAVAKISSYNRQAKNASASLSFRKYAGRHFLAVVSTDVRSMELGRSRSERELVTSRVITRATPRLEVIQVEARVR